MKTEVQRMNDYIKIAPALIRENTRLTDFLADSGFFKAPASKKYHGAYPGGLYDHSKAVFVHLDHLTATMQIEDQQWQRPESPFIVGMFHDLCKADEYKEVEDNPGKVMFGEAEPKGREIHYEYASPILKGHGEKSVMLLSQFITLTEEELLCIRFHMGAYESAAMDDYGRAISKYVNVLFTHTADMMASRWNGV